MTSAGPQGQPAGGPWVVGVDVDGTLFDGERIDPAAIAALTAAWRAGNTVMIVTGRPWRDLATVARDVLPVATCAVCEDGALWVDVATGTRHVLVTPPPRSLIDELRAAGVDDLVEGDVALGMPIERYGIAEQVVERHPGFHLVVNKRSVAVIPDGCDKASGLDAAIDHHGLSDHCLLAIGDAENDMPMFSIADVAVGVANADATVRDAGVLITEGAYGLGVAEAVTVHLGLDT